MRRGQYRDNGILGFEKKEKRENDIGYENKQEMKTEDLTREGMRRGQEERELDMRGQAKRGPKDRGEDNCEKDERGQEE